MIKMVIYDKSSTNWGGRGSEPQQGRCDWAVINEAGLAASTRMRMGDVAETRETSQTQTSEFPSSAHVSSPSARKLHRVPPEPLAAGRNRPFDAVQCNVAFHLRPLSVIHPNSALLIICDAEYWAGHT